jgi:hypothetical protein
MASIVIVTSQCYLLAEAINYIVINEVDDSDDREWQPKTAKNRKIRRNNRVLRDYIVERKPFNIVIDFIPKNQPQNASNKNNGDASSVITIQVHGLNRTLRVFQDVVSQLREQIPDELFLDKLVERFLADVEGNTPEKTIQKMGLQ